MRAAPTFAAIILSASAGACTTMADEAVAAGGAVVPPAYTPAEGLLLYREGPIEGAPDHHLVMGDLVLSAGTAVARHFHTGEEYLYVLAGDFWSGPGLRLAQVSVTGGRRRPRITLSTPSTSPNSIALVLPSWLLGTLTMTPASRCVPSPTISSALRPST